MRRGSAEGEDKIPVGGSMTNSEKKKIFSKNVCHPRKYVCIFFNSVVTKGVKDMSVFHLMKLLFYLINQVLKLKTFK